MAIVTGLIASIREVKLVTRCWESGEAVCVVAGINGPAGSERQGIALCRHLDRSEMKGTSVRCRFVCSHRIVCAVLNVRFFFGEGGGGGKKKSVLQTKH